MPTTVLGSIRKRVLTPPTSDVSFAVRGFDLADAPAREQLENSALQFVMGFEVAIEQRDDESTVTRLEALERQYHGFAYEGAAMAYTLRDVMSPKPGNEQTERFLSEGQGAKHIYMAYIGIGFALARLPKFLWKRALPEQSTLPDHSSLRMLIVDGYGFHQAFFHTDTWVRKQTVPGRIPWDGPHDYVLRVFDQGVGRAMWFVHGGNVEALTEDIGRFAAHRRSDLWSGAALAATYAGGVGEDRLEQFVRNSAPYRAEVSQGSVFAIKARVLADRVTEHTELASRVFCDMPADAASALADKAVIDLPEKAATPPYEIFRERIQSFFTA